MAPLESVLSSGSVVFALPHLREAIFFYHAAELVKDRKAQLDAIPRPVTDAFWNSFKEEDADEKPEVWFAKRLTALINGTNLLAVAEKLGLKPASYVEFLASRPHDVLFWLSACSVLGNSRKWDAGSRYRLRLEAQPRELKGGAAVHEEPQSNPAQMLWHANGYDRGYMYHDYDEWAYMEGLSHVLRDDIGRMYVMRLLDLRSQPFIFTAAASRPEIIFSDNSPFLPIYDVVKYNELEGLGAIIYQAPPCPLGPHLLPDSGQDELRRILERAHDCFANLAALEEWGISLNGSYQDSWTHSITTQSQAPLLLPAYLQKTLNIHEPGKLGRNGHYEEQLPPPPSTAWPLSPLAGKGGVAGLPWSQITAYNDPRVPGPRIFLHNVVQPNLNEADYKEGVARNPYRWQREMSIDRHHDDLLIVVRDLMDRFMDCVYGTRTMEVLKSSALGAAYEQCLLTGADNAPARCEQGHSGLFRFCANCALGWYETTNITHEYDAARCSTCHCWSMVTAVPDAFRRLLLRILEPETREDGSKIAVTAKEAHETMKSVMAAEIPRLQKLYEDWVDKQPKVERIATTDPLPLDKMQRDVSSARWMMFEMLRGNHLDARFRRADHIKLRDAMRAFHAEKKKREEEREAKRRGDMAVNAVDAPQRAGTSSPAADEGSASTSPRCTAAPDGVKRSVSGSEDEAKASKKAKAA